MYEPAAPPPTPAEPLRTTHWGFLDLLWFALFAVVSLLLAFVLGSIVFETWKLVTQTEATLNDQPYKTLFALAVQGLWWAMAVGFIYYIVVVKSGLDFLRSLGYVDFKTPSMNYVTGGFVLALSVGVLARLLQLPDTKLPIEELIEGPLASAAFALFAVFIAPPIEELVFRGFLFVPIERSKGAVTATIVTAAVFALPHAEQVGGQWQSLVLLFYVGCVLGLVRARTQSVIPSTLLHVSYNATLMAALLFAPEAAVDL